MVTNLKGKTAVVTGSACGIGKAIALRLAADRLCVAHAGKPQALKDKPSANRTVSL